MLGKRVAVKKDHCNASDALVHDHPQLFSHFGFIQWGLHVQVLVRFTLFIHVECSILITQHGDCFYHNDLFFCIIIYVGIIEKNYAFRDLRHHLKQKVRLLYLEIKYFRSALIANLLNISKAYSYKMHESLKE